MSRKKKQQPSPEELEDAATAMIANADRETLAAILANTQALCDGLEQLRLPNNDPEYLKRLQTSDAQRNAIANRLTQIDLVPDGNKTYIGVGSFTHHEAVDLARQMAEHFETRIRQFDPQ